MPNYPTSFVNTVNQACLDSDEFYKASSNLKETTPNPYYIGMGNPNSKILVIGKELAFDADNPKELVKLQNESINNPYFWQKIISENRSNLPFDPSYPYDGETHPKEGGRTWNRYQKLYESIDKHLILFQNDNFHRNFFYSELNIVPSKSSKGIKERVLTERINFFKNNKFFQEFEIVIFACGDYLSKYLKTSSEEEKIKDMFGIEKKCEMGGSYRKLNVYTDKNKLGIHTRQLSSGVGNGYLKEIASVINNYSDLTKS